MSDLKIEEGKIYEGCQVGKKTKMPYKMFQYHTRVYELSPMDFMRLVQGVVIGQKAGGKVEGPPNIEQPIVVHKKKLKKISDYDIIIPIGIPSHISVISTIKKYDIVFGEADIGVHLSLLNFRYKLYVRKHIPYILPPNVPHFDKSDLAAGENVLHVPLMYDPIRNYPPIQNIVDDKTNPRGQDDDTYVLDIQSDMLYTYFLIHKENGDVTPENNIENNVENIFINNPKNSIDNYVIYDDHIDVNIVVAYVDVVNNSNKKRKFAQKKRRLMHQKMWRKMLMTT